MRQLLLAALVTTALAVPAFAETPAPKDAAAPVAAEKAPVAPNKNTLARVDGQDITRKDLDALLAKLPDGARALPAPVLEPMAINQVINDRLLLKAANADNVSESKEYQTKLAEIKDQLLREVYIKSKVEKKITNDAIRAEYDKMRKENPEQTEYEARHMLVDTKEAAEGLIKQLDTGADFAKLAKENNKGPEKEKGGELGFFTAKEVVPEFAEAISKMGKGDITKQPVKTQFGWHVIQLEDKRTRAAPKFDMVKEQLRQRVQQQLVSQEIDSLRKAANVEVYSDNLAKMPKSEK